MTSGRFPFERVFVVSADHVSPIIAPSYFLFPEKSVADRVNEAMQSYGVRPSGDRRFPDPR